MPFTSLPGAMIYNPTEVVGNYAFLNSQTGVLIKSGAGVLIKIIVGIKDSLGTSVLTLYDGLDNTGQIMFKLGTGANTTPQVVDIGIGVGFNTGLYSSLGGGLQSPSVTVVYY